MWIAKNGAAPPKKAQPKLQLEQKLQQLPQKELHVPHQVEMEISGLLIQHGRLEARIGRRHLMHFVRITQNADGSVDHVVRSRMHTHTGLERNFESTVRIHPDQSLKLLR